MCGEEVKRYLMSVDIFYKIKIMKRTDISKETAKRVDSNYL